MVAEVLIAVFSLVPMFALFIAGLASALDHLPGRWPSAKDIAGLLWTAGTLFALSVVLCVVARRLLDFEAPLTEWARLAVRMAIPVGIICGLAVVIYAALSVLGAIRGPPFAVLAIPLTAVAVGVFEIPHMRAELRHQSLKQLLHADGDRQPRGAGERLNG